MRKSSFAFSIASVILLLFSLCLGPALGKGLGKAPGFSLKDIDKLQVGAVTLSSFEGKVVLLNVFTTTCDICRAEFPNLIAVHEQYSEREDVQVVGIAMDPMVEAVQSLVRAVGINYTVLMGDLETLVSWDIKAFPTSFLINQRGQILQEYVGFHDISVFVSDIEAIVGEE